MNTKIYPVQTRKDKSPLIDENSYKEMYELSINSPDIFWAEQANKFISWTKKWSKVSDCDYNTGKISWFEGAELNVCFNCIDRHLPEKANQNAILWEGNDPKNSKKLTYQQLHNEVCKFANGLKKLDVKKGDRVCIYMPMILEATIAMLACSRIGAVHSVVFAGFSAEALRARITDAHAKVVITADEGLRGVKKIALKNSVDKAVSECDFVEHIVVVKHTGCEVKWSDKNIWYSDLVADMPEVCEVEIMKATDPLFILYTSGSTGTPKGVLHSSGGYLLYSAMTHKYVFDYQDGDIYWCTADIGWITGHSYIVYGPLANGATSVMFEGVPNYPDASRFWQIVDKYKVNIFYTAPTAIRSLMSLGEEFLQNTSRASLRVLGTVGEPINPEAWEWYYHKVGLSNCPIVDTWWQTETGGHMILSFPFANKLKPSSAGLPFFGIKIELLDKEGNELNGVAEGVMAISTSWPGQMSGLYNNPKRFMDAYFSDFKGKYFPGDGAKRDSDGYLWITGRVDDVLNVSGHRIGTAEIESALTKNSKVAESAIVGIDHEIKGQSIYAFVCLKPQIEPSEELKKELNSLVRKNIGAIASLDAIQFSPDLPKTRSGKIMRRVLRKIANNNFDSFGDLSTLAEPEIVDILVEGKKKLNK